jgi:hypothetical protein
MKLFSVDVAAATIQIGREYWGLQPHTGKALKSFGETEAGPGLGENGYAT